MNIEDLRGYLGELSEKSTKGNIQWDRVNSAAFRWVQGVGHTSFVTTIQKTTNPVIVNGRQINREFYVLQIHEKGKSEPVVSISSRDRSDLAAELKNIYVGAEASMDILAVNVLSKLLGR